MGAFYADRPQDREQTVKGMAISHAAETLYMLQKTEEKLAKPQRVLQNLLRGRRSGNTAAESAAIATFDTDTDMDQPQTGWLISNLPG
jgi:hypothetical protein